MAPAELRGAPRRHTVVAGSDARTSLLRHRRFRAKARLALRARNANPFWRGLRPTGGGGENRTRVRSSVPQDLYERSPGSGSRLSGSRGTGSLKTSRGRESARRPRRPPGASQRALTPASVPADAERIGARV